MLSEQDARPSRDISQPTRETRPGGTLTLTETDACSSRVGTIFVEREGRLASEHNRRCDEGLGRDAVIELGETRIAEDSAAC